MNESVNVSVILPTDVEETLNVDTSLNVQYLKLTVERIYGIPSELQTIHHADVVLENDVILDTVGVVEGSRIFVKVDILWSKLVGLCLKGNNLTLYRRVSVARQHGEETDRVFISLFISATRGYVMNLTSLLSNYSAFDLKTRTKVTGRTLLHAAVGSGHLEGLAAIKKHAGMGFERLLYVQDRWGTSAIDELRTRNESMMHYINKFVSEPRTPDQVEKKTREIFRRGSKLFGGAPVQLDAVTVNAKTTEVKETEAGANKENGRQENNGKITTPRSEPTSPVNKDVGPKLSRPKRSDGTLNVTKGILKNTTQRSRPQSPKSRPQSLCVDAENNLQNTVPNSDDVRLPRIKSPLSPTKNDSPRPRSSTSTGSPRPQRSSKTPKRLSEPTSDSPKSPDNLVVPVFDKVLTPSPPTERKPTAGILKNRKTSAAASRKQSTTSGNLSPPAQPSLNRAKSVEPVEKLLASPPRDRANSAGKVRRISLFQGPKTKSQTLNPDSSEEVSPVVDSVPVFTLEEGRIEKPWNNWIKAVSVDVESAEGKALLQSPPTERNRKMSNYQTTTTNHDNNSDNNNNNMNHHDKKSFEEWCLYKEQEKMTQMAKLKEAKTENERKELQARYKKQGKTFEEWLRTKQMYLSLLKQQEQEDERMSLAPRKLLNGKTFEQWMKETEEKEKNEAEVMKKQQKVKVEEAKVSKERRRKESTAKYQQWLVDKEKEAMEKELKEFHQIKNNNMQKKDQEKEEGQGNGPRPRSRTSSMKK